MATISPAACSSSASASANSRRWTARMALPAWRINSRACASERSRASCLAEKCACASSSRCSIASIRPLFDPTSTAQQPREDEADVPRVVAGPVMDPLQGQIQQAQRLVHANLAGQSVRQGEEGLDVQMAGTERVRHTLFLALAFELPAVVVAVAGPDALFRQVHLLQPCAGVGESYAAVHLFLGQRRQAGAIGADGGAPRAHQDTLTGHALSGGDRYRAKADLDDLRLLSLGRLALPTGRFQVDHHDRVK